MTRSTLTVPREPLPGDYFDRRWLTLAIEWDAHKNVRAFRDDGQPEPLSALERKLADVRLRAAQLAGVSP